jgi:hypothetical protein
VVLGFNTNLTKGQPVPRSYNDLLLPRWKGRKISVDDTYATFLQGLISVWGKDKALEYLKKLADQEPCVMRGSTVRVQLAAAGEFPLVIAYANIIQYLAEKGARWIGCLSSRGAYRSTPLWLELKRAIPTRRSCLSISRFRKKARKNYGISSESHREATSSQNQRDCFAVTSVTWSILKKLRRFEETAGLYSQILKTR